MKTPPLLLSAALLFWGWQTKFLVAAVLMGIVLESVRLVKWRWELSRTEWARVADLCSLILIGTLLYRVLAQSLTSGGFLVFLWMPFTLFPLVAFQCYSASGMVDARALFLTFRKKRARIHAEPLPLDVTFPYVIVCIISSGTANVRTPWFYLGVLALIGWALWSLRSKRHPWWVWSCMILLAGVIGYWGHLRLHEMQLALEVSPTLLRWIVGYQDNTDPYQSTTAIGSIRTIKLSNQVLFRVKSDAGHPSPLLLREASYNLYRSTQWYAPHAEFTDVAVEADDTTWKLQPRSDPFQRLTVSAYLTNRAGILTLPYGTFQLKNLLVGNVMVNQFGAVKVEEGPSFVTYQALFQPPISLDSLPNEDDLSIPPTELPALQQFADALTLSALSPEETVQRLVRFFQEEFSYALDLQRKQMRVTPVEDFLRNTRAGHCEYFATATVLLLRAAGIPARYAVGYAVDGVERPGRWALVRGSDAHAWTLAYVHGAWHDVDTTPATWRAIEALQASPFERLSDLWAQLKFAVLEWRWRLQNRQISWYWGLSVIPLFLLLFWRLYSRRRITYLKTETPPVAGPIKYPGADSEFYLIEHHLRQRGFVRPDSEPLLAWLQRLETQSPQFSIQMLYSLLRLHYRYRFDPDDMTSAEREDLRSSVQRWLAEQGERKALET